MLVEHAGQELDRDEQGQGWPARDDPADHPGPGGRHVRGQAPGRAYGERSPGQPARPTARAPVGEQDQRGDDLDAVDRQRERVGVPAGLAVALGELAHVAIGDGTGDPGQPGHRGRGRDPDQPVRVHRASPAPVLRGRISELSRKHHG